MRKFLLRALALVVILIGAVYVWNASWRAAPPSDPQVRLIAHRGVHQNFDRAGIQNDTCTATRIREPINPVMENTIESMRLAFEAGADVVELDVHPTTDGHFAIFHDWTLDCRTEGTGATRSHDLAYLKTLDIGFGYTADEGKTYPLRGTGVGLMPSLDEVFTAFPEGRFLINYKSRETREGDMLAAILAARPEWRPLVWSAYGGNEPTERASALIADLNGTPTRGAKDCLIQYFATGWTGIVPEPCRNTKVMVPINFAWALWGWRNLFLERMRQNGSEVILLGPYNSGDPGTGGIDDLETLAEVPPSFDGYIWTNRIELVGPAVRGGNMVATLR